LIDRKRANHRVDGASSLTVATKADAVIVESAERPRMRRINEKRLHADNNRTSCQRADIMTILRSLLGGASIAALLAACAVRLENTEPAEQLARESMPSGSAYEGWRLFNQRCAGCHGKDAAAPAPMPDLLDRVAQMGPRRFANLVLVRYDWSKTVAEDEGYESIPRIYLQKTPLGGTQVLEMPAWANDPAVVGHVADLYAYLSARADGRLGTGSPPR
jgi:hypothetical protein